MRDMDRLRGKMSACSRLECEGWVLFFRVSQHLHRNDQDGRGRRSLKHERLELAPFCLWATIHNKAQDRIIDPTSKAGAGDARQLWSTDDG